MRTRILNVGWKGEAASNSTPDGELHSTALRALMFCFSGARGLRKDLFGRYKKKDGSRSRSRSPQRHDKPRGR